VQRLAVAFYDAPSRDLLGIAVCGSHGKTTTSWLIRGILEEVDQVSLPCHSQQPVIQSWNTGHQQSNGRHGSLQSTHVLLVASCSTSYMVSA
jgi:UDP-N-acetylmuramate-alanine ligase